MSVFDKNGNDLVEASNPIFGKTVWAIGDSNFAYNSAKIKSHLEETYGVTYRTFAVAGYAWGTPDTENGFATTDNSAIGQLNRIISECDGDTDAEYFAEDKHIFLFMMGTNPSPGGTGDSSTKSDPSTAYGGMAYCFDKISRYARVGNTVGVIIPIDIPEAEKTNLIALCESYAIPYIDIMKVARIYKDNGNNFITDGANHMAANGVMHFNRVIGKWITYQI